MRNIGLTTILADLIVASVTAIFARLGGLIKSAWPLAIVLMATMFLPSFAFAQDGGVEIPWGQWLVDAINASLPTVLLVLSSLVTVLVAKFAPAWLQVVIGDKLQRQINEVLEKAVLSAAAQTKNAVAGKTLSLAISNVVLLRAAQYAVEFAPKLVKKVTGGDGGALIKMIMARMEDLGLLPAGYDIERAKDAVHASGFSVTEIAEGNSGGFDFGGALGSGFGK